MQYPLDMRNDFYVYAYLRNKTSASGVSGTPYYIGKGRRNRVLRQDRLTSVPKDQKFIQFLATGLNEPDAFQIEMLQIFLHGRKDLNTGILHNRTDGGEGCTGRCMTEKERQRVGLMARSRVFNPEDREKCGRGNRGRRQPPEEIHRRAASLRGAKRSEEFKSKLKGHQVSKETRDKIRASLLGRKRPPEVIAKMSESRRGIRFSDQARKNMSLAQLRRHALSNAKTE